MAQIEHIGIAVEDVEAVVECFQDLLGVRPYKAETVPTQHVRTHFLDGTTAKLELLEALDEASPVQRYLDRKGEGLHHLAFEVSDLAATMDRLQDAGFTLLGDPPQSGADDKRIVFVHPTDTHGVLVEFCESVTPTWSPTFVPRHDGHLAVFERGTRDRPTLLILHGAAGTTRHETAPLIRRLESTFHVVGIDLSGHGTSALPTGTELSLPLLAEDVRVVLDDLDLPEAHVFGFSLGGGVALHLAHEHPDRVRRLALHQTNVQWTRDQADRMLGRLDIEALQDQASPRAERLRARHEHPERLLRLLRAFVERLPDRSDALLKDVATLSASTLVGAVDRDPLFGLESPRLLYEQLPDARLAILPGTRHRLADTPLSILSQLLRRHFSPRAE